MAILIPVEVVLGYRMSKKDWNWVMSEMTMT